MTTRDDDIDFDFFEEPATQEASQRTQRAPVGTGDGGGGGRPPRDRKALRAPTGFTPLLRLIGLVAAAILVVVLLVFWVQGCQEDSERDAYQAYMTEVEGVAQDSEAIGRDLRELLTTPGLKQADVDQRLAGLVQRQQLGVESAQELDPPGATRVAHDALVQSLAFRVGGLRGLAEVFEQTAGSDDAAEAGAQLATQAQRFVASDVVWEDLFRAPAVQELQRQDITGVDVPSSAFVQTADFATQRQLTPIWQRIHGASTGGTPTGLHGTGIAGVRVLPSGKQLTAGSDPTTIQASTDLAFEVSVTDTGDAQEVGVEVTLTIPKQPESIVKKQTIDIIDAGETKTVTFRNFPTLPFGEEVNLRVDVKPVPGETNTGNNTVEFPVNFSI